MHSKMNVLLKPVLRLVRLPDIANLARQGLAKCVKEGCRAHKPPGRLSPTAREYVTRCACRSSLRALTFKSLISLGAS